MTRVFQGKLNYVDAAKELNLPVPSVWRCFTEHWETVSEEEGIAIKMKEAKAAGDFVSILRENVQLFIDRLQEAKNLPVSSLNERAVTTLSGELRGIMRDILEFEGKLKTGLMIQISLQQMQMTKLTSFLLTNLCDEDKKRLMEVLPQIISETSENVMKINQ